MYVTKDESEKDSWQGWKARQSGATKWRQRKVKTVFSELPK